MDLNLTTKEVTGQNAPVGAALVAQAMSGGEVSVRYKAMQAVKDWDRTRLGYRAVKRAFDIVFSGCVLAVIAFERGRNRLQEFVHGFIAVFLLPAMLIKQVFPNQKNADAHLIRRRYLLVLGIRLQIINQLSHLLLAEGTKALRAHALF